MQTIIAAQHLRNQPETAFTRTKIGQAANGNDHGNGQANRALIDAMEKSNVYQEYEKAFTSTTGLSVSLTPVETWQLPHHGRRGENPFCALIAQKSRPCAMCLQSQEKLCNKAATEAKTVNCAVGLSDTAVPVRMGNKLIGFLHTGQLFRKTPTETQFNRVAKLTTKWGIEANRSTLRRAYFSAKVVPVRQHESVVKLLTIFSQHLAMLGNQIFMQKKNAEPPAIARARAFIYEHQTESLTLGQVARSINTSAFYFCKLFKKVTGINFTEYVSRVRIERAKNLLLNPNLRVSEIAYEVGFESLTHFNRVFKKILGQSPTDYREQLFGHS